MSKHTNFQGLSGISNMLSQRQQKKMEETLINKMDEVVEECRRHVLNLYQKGKELAGAALENEMVVFLAERHGELGLNDRIQIARSIKNELDGYGPLQDLFDNKTVTDIVVAGPDKIVYEQDGILRTANAKFRSETHLRLFVERLCYLGRSKVDESRPSVTLTLPEGHRVAVAIPPLTECTNIAARKFVYIGPITGLVPDTFSKEAAAFSQYAARGRLNIVFCGPMGTGKTTMIAVLGYEFDPLELPVLVEEVRECPLTHPYLRNYVSRPPNLEGKGEIAFDYILKHALQSRATRILVAEVRDGAIFYMLRGFATGQCGMGTMHAESPEHAVRVQIPMMLGQAKEAVGMDQNSRNMIIGSAVDIIVQLAKVYDPATNSERRVCTHISEVQFSKGEPVEVKDIFVRRGGELAPTGYKPVRAIEKMARNKVRVPLEIFSKGVI
ncbi:type II/IV secretion system ATP hydrolase TadA/V irB11/CpaF [Desulfocucumis palustris]|uniref:Type II/IV secretion system ATP hydrolase TadA/V irB11/CpaF n=1 Tax=Desulfocucumis palustris TaxID=1898651 RepID=A0A2L2XH54_9FIRM|nr:ATPase, T2SS/T4P/T4SS family [Desulfocucumis palustris]GBF35462.1 type II/IV secretion system ATP hydrolase TadA/V irB11/CpaF [Desulfocucumis palustris]